MYFYVIPEKQVSGELLIYSWDKDIPIGQIISIKLRNKLIFGVVYRKIQDQRFKPVFEIKPVEEIHNFRLNLSQLNLLEYFSQNSFVSKNQIFKAFAQSFKILSQSNQKKLSQFQNINQENYSDDPASIISSDSKPNIEYLQNSQALIRIIYLIRSLINNFPNQTILLLVPEKKYFSRIKIILDSIDKLKEANESYLEIKNSNMNQKSSQNAKLWKFSEIFEYYPKGSKNDQKIVLDLIQLESQAKVIVTTRSGVFLPFRKVDHIFLYDESNNFYIQEQNSLYFDTREIVYFLALVYNSRLTFYSEFSSVRMHDFQKKTR